MTNVVLVRHDHDYGCGNYLFETPVNLKKGQRVRVKTRRGESDAIVMHDSAEVDKNALAMMVTACHASFCALPGFVDSKNEEKTERNAGYLVVSHSGGGMLRQGTRKGIRRTPANRGMRAHRIVKSLDISEDVCHGLCP